MSDNRPALPHTALSRSSSAPIAVEPRAIRMNGTATSVPLGAGGGSASPSYGGTAPESFGELVKRLLEVHDREVQGWYPHTIDPIAGNAVTRPLFHKARFTDILVSSAPFWSVDMRMLKPLCV